MLLDVDIGNSTTDIGLFDGQKNLLFLASLDTVENRALELLGKDKLQTLTGLLLEYDNALQTALEESR